MAGHNKWSKVKHIKASVDAKKGKIFSKISKELTLAAKSGGDPALNARLRQAILAAKEANMPADTMDRAIKKGTGELEGVSYEEAMYEGYGIGGAAFLVEVVTDNKNRAANDIRTLFSKNGGSIAESGSVAFQFQRKGEIQLTGHQLNEDQALEIALEAGADDVIFDGENHLVYTATEQLAAVANRLRELGQEPKSVRLVYLPLNSLSLEDPDTVRVAMKLYELLDDYDDSQNVFTNFEISDEILDALD